MLSSELPRPSEVSSLVLPVFQGLPWRLLLAGGVLVL